MPLQGSQLEPLELLQRIALETYFQYILAWFLERQTYLCHSMLIVILALSHTNANRLSAF